MRRTVVSLLLLAACGDNAKGIELDELDMTRRAAECERYTRCGLFDDEDACNTFFRAAKDPNLFEQVSRGLIRFDPLAAEACNRAIAQLGCDVTDREVRILPDVCNHVLIGTLPTAATCVADRECASRHCSAPSCGRDACCAGGCEAYAAPAHVGEACTDEIGCEAAAFCGRDLTCHVLGSLGAACDADDECAFGTACVGATEFQAGACRVLPKLGEECPYLRCAEIGARCSAEQMCVPAGVTGASCTRDGECSRFYTCDPTSNQCVELPQLGMPCSGRCAGESFCDVVSGQSVCIPPQPNAAPCTADNQCLTAYCEEGPIFDQCGSEAVCF